MHGPFSKWMFALATASLVIPTALAATGGPDAFGYKYIDSLEPGGPVFAWEDMTTATPTGQTCDDCLSGALPIGFTFDFYGVGYTTARACSNGFVVFGTGTSCSFTTRAIPSTFTPNNMIAAWWEDLHAGPPTPPNVPQTAKISYATHGDAGARVFVIEYFAMGQFSACRAPNPGAPAPAPPAIPPEINQYDPCRATFQVKLFEGSNNIEVHYLAAISDRDGTGLETVGIENAAGSVGLQYYRGDGNDMVLRAVRFFR